ncbi:rho guanine nucleotide exchange factor 38 [Solea senegalensis]|uniref:Dynamin-binding protein n=1 Tax=Solea senegalensis TaxID=28829 RepID=A0AAV6Q9F9_SOLSE|nr:rho guanine nucleotide exchange factor 38 [Solea senegalensis]KAG7485385.1 rho guanine nucleotide exchange factor 38 [Solea senegalensis]
MNPSEAGGSEKEREKEKEKVIKRRNRPVFLRYLERRRTDTIVAQDMAKGDINLGTLVRRSQSDKTEYSAKLKEKMTPLDLSAPPSPAIDPEEVGLRKMKRRAKVIQELVQTEKDFLTGLELCIREVVQPLRNMQVVDIDRLFTNMETVCEVSAALLHRLQEAMADSDPEAVVIGEVFIQAKAALEDVYKIYCYHYDDANMSLKSYEKEEEIKQHFTTCVLALKKIYDQEGKPNLLDMGSLLIKPVQRIMKYPLLLGELWQATPEDHPDYCPLQEAFTAAKIINININEFKRRKDIVMKYKRSEDEGTLRGKLHKFNIHSIRKKGDRFAGYLKILTGVEPQVRDEIFDKEEKLFRGLEKAVRQLVKNVHCYLQHTQEMVSVAVQNVQDMENIVKDPSKNGTNGSMHSNGNDPYKHFKNRVERLVLAPLSSLQGMFTAPQKLIQKRYDKLLDYCSRLERSSSFSSSSSTTTSSPSLASEDPSGPARRDYEALNAMLVEELNRFNMAAYTILTNCVLYLVTLLRELVDKILLRAPSIQQLPPPLSNIVEVQNSIMDGLNNLAFVKDNAQRLMERKVSFERQRDKKTTVMEVQHQTEEQRAWLLAEYPPNRLYQLKRKCNGCQEQDLSLLEGELVALLEDTDPLGSSSRWLVHTGGTQGYVYSTFLKQYNPLRDSQRGGQRVKEQQQQQQQQQQQHQPSAMVEEDFDDISLFVSGSGSSSLLSFNLTTTDSSSTLSGLQGELESPEDMEDLVDTEAQQFYAVYAFQARCDQELTLQEYQHVRILQFCDLGGNKDWWLAEANGQKGYVPANYLGRMSYA